LDLRAIKDLSQLADDEFFAQVSEGLALILRNATQIQSDSDLLAESERSRGRRILDNLVREEAAKYLILIDAVRCD